MLLFSALHNSVLFVLTYNAEECQKSNKYCLNGIITYDAVVHIDYYENHKKIDQCQHISSCGKFLLCSGQHYLFICEYTACSSLRNAFLFVKD